MVLNLLKHRWQKVVLSVLLILVSVVLIALFVLNQFGTSFLEKKVNNALLKASDSLYRVRFDKARLHVFKREIIIDNVTLIPDTALYFKKKKTDTVPVQIYSVNIQKVVISTIHPLKLYFKHQLDIGQILLSTPQIQIASYPSTKNKKKPKDNRTLYQRLSQSLKSVHIGEIIFDDVKLNYKGVSGSSKPAIHQFKKLNLKAYDLLIDSATQLDKKRFLYCQNLAIELHKYSGQSAKALYGYKARLVKYDTQSRQLQVHDFVMNSLQNPARFFQRTYDDYFDVRTRLLQFNNFDIESYDKNHTIRASSLLLDEGNIKVFSNPRTNPQSLYIDKSITFPNRTLHSMKVKVKIDTVNVRRYVVSYKEYNPKAKRSGYIIFDHIHGRFRNVTNDSVTLLKNKLCYVDVSSRFMNRASLKLNFVFNLTDSLYSYNYRGTLGPMPLPLVNVATVPLASIKIQTGEIKKLSFAVQANRHMAKGHLTLLYNNLKIQLLKADSAELKMRRLALVSLLANTLILKANNPDDKEKQPRYASILYQRPKTYPFFETLWRTLLMGIQSSVGLDAKSQRDADVKMAKKEKEKYLKEHKKEARKQEKEEKRRLKKLKKQQKKAKKEAEKQSRDAEKKRKSINKD